MRRALKIIGVEVLAIAFAVLRMQGGVVTDEAKYLLNIPYPHPPLIRFVMGLTKTLPQQELLWRILLATLLFQAVWIVRGMLPPEKSRERNALAGLWLLSGGVLLSAGSILMAPVTAVALAAFCALLLRRPSARFAPWIAILWLASLFTAYQSLLFLPIILAIFWEMDLPVGKKLIAVLGPVLLLALYTATNPLIVPSITSAGSQNFSAQTLVQSLRGVLRLWAVGGSILLSILGLFGMFRTRSHALILTLLLLCAYSFLSFRFYYVVLFPPLLLAGAASIPFFLRRPLILTAIAAVTATYIFVLFPLNAHPSGARATIAAIRLDWGSGALLVDGSFGHEWQYESPVSVLRYRPELLNDAAAVVRLSGSGSLDPAIQKAMVRVSAPTEVWVRR